ncbi:fatty acid amide hydrolase-like protein [Tanacetum coccineum]
MCNISTIWDDEIYHATRCEAQELPPITSIVHYEFVDKRKKIHLTDGAPMPASVCGDVGLKPSFGRVPHLGVIPWNLECHKKQLIRETGYIGSDVAVPLGRMGMGTLSLLILCETRHVISGIIRTYV